MLPSPIRAEYHRWASDSSASATASRAIRIAIRTTAPAGRRTALRDGVDDAAGEHRRSHTDRRVHDDREEEHEDVAPERSSERQDAPGGAAAQLAVADLILAPDRTQHVRAAAVAGPAHS